MKKIPRSALVYAACCLLPYGAQSQTVLTANLPEAPTLPSLRGSTALVLYGSLPPTPGELIRTTPAQEQTSVPPNAPSAPSSAAQSSSSSDQLKEEEKQRLLGIMPAFNTVQSGAAVPLRPSQKFNLWYHSAVDPFTFGIAAIDGGLEQAQNTYPEYGQGVQGFAKRFGASYADSVDGNFWGNAVLPSLLHQDPRYFRLGTGSAKRRLAYAALSTVRCKGDNGRWQPSYSNIGGNLIGGAISNVYYPAADRGVGLTLERGFTVTAEGVIGALAFEFYPDLVQHFKQRHQHGNAAASATSPASPAEAAH